MGYQNDVSNAFDTAIKSDFGGRKELSSGTDEVEAAILEFEMR